MSPIQTAITNLPEEKLINIVEREIMTELAKLINSKSSVKNKTTEVDKLRTSELFLSLPETSQKEMLENFDTFILAFKEMAAIKY